jgi:hypothetical protein
LDEKLTVVLPVAAHGTGRDTDDPLRFELALSSFLRYFRREDVHQFLVICPPADAAELADRLRQKTADERFQVLSELEVCPELADDPQTLVDWPVPNRGWYRQQIIKLAAHERVKTTRYLTLDADILTVRRCAIGDLLRGSRAVCGTESVADYRALYTAEFAEVEASRKRERMQHAERVLGRARAPEHAARFYSETPVLFDTEIVGRLAAHLAIQHRRPYRRALIDVLPWTEVCLYFCFLEAFGLFDDRYVAAGRNAILRLDDSLWQPADHYRAPRSLDTWDAARVFSSAADGFFVAIQSFLGYPVARIAGAVAGYV